MIEDIKDMIREEMKRQGITKTVLAERIGYDKRSVVRNLDNNGTAGSIYFYEEACHFLGIYIIKKVSL